MKNDDYLILCTAISIIAFLILSVQFKKYGGYNKWKIRFLVRGICKVMLQSFLAFEYQRRDGKNNAKTKADLVALALETRPTWSLLRNAGNRYVGRHVSGMKFEFDESASCASVTLSIVLIESAGTITSAEEPKAMLDFIVSVWRQYYKHDDSVLVKMMNDNREYQLISQSVAEFKKESEQRLNYSYTINIPPKSDKAVATDYKKKGTGVLGFFNTLVIKYSTLEKKYNGGAIGFFNKHDNMLFQTDHELVNYVDMGWDGINAIVKDLSDNGLQNNSAPVDFYIVSRNSDPNIKKIDFYTKDDGQLIFDFQEWDKFLVMLK